jgi:hypothetical protein
VKVVTINFSGNVGKTTVAKQLLAPRIEGAAEFVIETINAGASDVAGSAERLKGKNFGALLEEIATKDRAIVDIGASNVEDVVTLLGQFEGSHEDFDYYVVPVVSEKKQQQDSVNTIKALAQLGVTADKIRVVFNRVDVGDADEIPSLFSTVCGYHGQSKHFVLRQDAVIFKNEIFDRLRPLKRSVAEMAADDTDYRAALREAKDDAGKARAISMLSAQRLAKSAHRNLDAAYKALFS